MLGAVVFALVAGSAWADKPAGTENKTNLSNAAPPEEERTFAELDKNNNRYISRAEAAADPVLAKDFDKFDLNHDGKLSCAEYLAARGKEDTRAAANKVSGKDKAKTPACSSGSSVK